MLQYEPYWRAGQYGESAFGSSKRITLYTAKSFFDFLAKANDAEDLVGLDYPALPKQAAAPLMFRPEGDAITLEHVPLAEIGGPQARGAVRALTNQVRDVIAIGGLENAIPRANAKLGRILDVLTRIEGGGCAEQADIVELGVEVSGIESRIYEGRSRLSELSLGEVLAFLAEAKRFLDRFESWRTYEEAARRHAGELATDAANSAVEVLKAAAASGLVDEQVRERIASAVEAMESTSDARMEGITRSAENFSAAAGKAVVDFVASEMKSTAKETERKVSETLAHEGAKFLIKNASTLYHIAQSRGERWLELLLHWIRDGNWPQQ